MRALTSVIGVMLAAPACAEPATTIADFYRGKTINLVVGHEAGTGYDFFGRRLARHISRHVPGHPAIVPQNMPGAGGTRAANWLYNVAARDGTVLSVFAPETALKPIFGDAAANYEPAKFSWIGNIDESVATCTVSARSGIATLDALRSREALFGATGVAAPTSKFAYALINFIGARIKVVQGYKGSNDLRIALNRGEIEGACGPSYSTLRTQWKDDIDSGRIRVLVQFGLKPLPELKGAAHIYDYAATPELREIFDIAFGPHVLGRPVIAPPGVPAERTQALRDAFMATMAEADLRAELAKLGLAITPSSGEAVAALVARFASVPKRVIEKATAGLHP
jgi:tripartite-type tricarboxylate transporter receptor subunit TctC